MQAWLVAGAHHYPIVAEEMGGVAKIWAAWADDNASLTTSNSEEEVVQAAKEACLFLHTSQVMPPFQANS